MQQVPRDAPSNGCADESCDRTDANNVDEHANTCAGSSQSRSKDECNQTEPDPVQNRRSPLVSEPRDASIHE
ncbi:MAG: hypothetical protein AAFP86_01265, partial [Planctomycetota bacterium]